MQRSSATVANLHRDVTHSVCIAESLFRHSRYAGVVHTEVKMRISHALEESP